MDNENLSIVQSLAKQITPSSQEITIQPFLTYATKSNLIEVPDPYYGGESGFDQVLDLLDDACDGFISHLNLL